MQEGSDTPCFSNRILEPPLNHLVQKPEERDEVCFSSPICSDQDIEVV